MYCSKSTVNTYHFFLVTIIYQLTWQDSFFVIFYLYLCHFFSISLCVCIGISLSFDCTVPLLYFFVTENYTQGGWKITRNPMLLETGDEAIFCGLTSAHPFTPFIEIYLSIYLCIYPPTPLLGVENYPPTHFQVSFLYCVGGIYIRKW